MSSSTTSKPIAIPKRDLSPSDAAESYDSQGMSPSGFGGLVTEKISHLARNFMHLISRDGSARKQRPKNEFSDMVLFDDDDDLFSSKAADSVFEDDSYTVDGIKQLSEKYGVAKKLGSLGFSDLVYEIDTSDQFVHKVAITDSSLIHMPDQDKYLIRFFVRRKTMSPEFKKEMVGTLGYELMKEKLWNDMKVTVIEWLHMQNPKLAFDEKTFKYQLPGQRYPGLGTGRIILKLFSKLAEMKKRDAIVNLPEHFHNAYLYNRVDLRFEAEEQILAISPRMKAYISSSQYVVRCFLSLKFNQSESE